MCLQTFPKLVDLCFQRSHILFADCRQIVNKVVIVQFVGETEQNFNKGLKTFQMSKLLQWGVHVEQIRAL